MSKKKPGADLNHAKLPGHWLLARLGKRVLLHELSLGPDELDLDTQDKVRNDLSRSIRVGARPLTVRYWRSLLEGAGFEVVHEHVVSMLLLEPRRLVEDEGWARAAQIVFNIMRSPTARRRVLAMRSTFSQHQENLGAVALVGVKPMKQTATT